LFQEATTMMVQHWAKKTEPKPFEKRVVAANNVVEEFARFYSSKNESGDIAFNIQNKQIKAHRCALSYISAELDALIATSSGVTLDPKYNRISDRAFEALLKYLYYNDIPSIKLLYACQLHQFAIDFKLQKLVSVLEKQMEVLECDDRSAVFLLEVAYTEMEHDKRLRKLLRKKGIVHITDNMDKIDFSPVENMPAVIGTDIVLALQKVVKGAWEVVGSAVKDGIKANPITSNFPGNGSTPAAKRLDNSEKSEAGDPSERSSEGLSKKDRSRSKKKPSAHNTPTGAKKEAADAKGKDKKE